MSQYDADRKDQRDLHAGIEISLRQNLCIVFQADEIPFVDQIRLKKADIDSITERIKKQQSQRDHRRRDKAIGRYARFYPIHRSIHSVLQIITPLNIQERPAAGGQSRSFLAGTLTFIRGVTDLLRSLLRFGCCLLYGRFSGEYRLICLSMYIVDLAVAWNIWCFINGLACL